MKFIDYLKQHCTAEECFELDGRTYDYMVMNTSEGPALPDFCGVIDGRLFISSDVKPTFRKFYLGHEVECKLSGFGGKYSCKEALIRELERVPKEDKQDYVLRRLLFFENLVRYIYERKEPCEGFMEGIKESLYHLRQLNRQLNRQLIKQEL